MITPEEHSDILVIVAHPFGNIEAPLETWIENGPGPRPYVGIIAARRKSTGESLPMDEIPLEYHNSAESRARQRQGLLPWPWGAPPEWEPWHP